MNENPNTVTLKDGLADLVDDERVGIVYSLEDSGAEDIIQDSCVTQFWGKFGFRPYADGTTDTSAASLKINFFQADVDETDLESLESEGISFISF